MKKVIYAVVIFATIGLTNSFGQTEKADLKKDTTITMANFGVRGNCGMCKKTIEKAATGVKGVAKADWNKESKSIMVEFDNGKTNIMAIHEAIAASGYDTDKLDADANAYKNLPGCCLYDHNMKMSQNIENKNDKKEVHKH